MISENELWPSPDYPQVPILLECGGIAQAGWGHRRSRHLYILWRYDRESSTWMEISRTVGTDADWVLDILPAAARAISDQQAPPPHRDCPEVAQQLLILLDKLLEQRADDRERRTVLDLVYNGVTYRMLDEDEDAAWLASAGYTVSRAAKKEPGSARPGFGQDARQKAV